MLLLKDDSSLDQINRSLSQPLKAHFLCCYCYSKTSVAVQCIGAVHSPIKNEFKHFIPNLGREFCVMHFLFMNFILFLVVLSKFLDIELWSLVLIFFICYRNSLSTYMTISWVEIVNKISFTIFVRDCHY